MGGPGHVERGRRVQGGEGHALPAHLLNRPFTEDGTGQGQPLSAGNPLVSVSAVNLSPLKALGGQLSSQDVHLRLQLRDFALELGHVPGVLLAARFHTNAPQRLENDADLTTKRVWVFFGYILLSAKFSRSRSSLSSASFSVAASCVWNSFWRLADSRLSRLRTVSLSPASCFFNSSASARTSSNSAVTWRGGWGGQVRLRGSRDRKHPQLER